MKKLNVLLMTLVTLIGMAGCSAIGKDKDAKPVKVEPTAIEVLEKIQEKMAEKYEMTVVDGVVSDTTTGEPLYKLMDIKKTEETKYFPSAEHFNADDIKEGYILEPIDSTSSSELIIIVEANDGKAANNVSKAMQKVLSDQQEFWSEHIGNQHQLVKDNKIETQGNFVLYVTSEHQSEILKAFQEKVR